MGPGTFEQRRLLSKRTYSLGPAGVEYHHRAPFSSFGGTVRFDQLAPELQHWTGGVTTRWLWAAGVLAAMALLLLVVEPTDGGPRPYGMVLFWAGLGLLALGRWLAGRTHWVGYDPLYLFAHRPSAPEVAGFLARVDRQRVNRNLSVGRQMVETGQWTEAQFQAWQRRELGAVHDAPPEDPNASSAYI